MHDGIGNGFLGAALYQAAGRRETIRLLCEPVIGPLVDSDEPVIRSEA
jgi:hypothetical protein